MLQLLKPSWLQPVLCNKSEHYNKEYPLLTTTRESPCAAMKTQCNQNQYINFLKSYLKKKKHSKQDKHSWFSLEEQNSLLSQPCPAIAPTHLRSLSLLSQIIGTVSYLISRLWLLYTHPPIPATTVKFPPKYTTYVQQLPPTQEHSMTPQYLENKTQTWTIPFEALCDPKTRSP